MGNNSAIELTGKLVLLGAGKMGGAMLAGWLAAGLTGDQIVVLDPGPPAEVMQLISDHGIAHNPVIGDITDCAVVLVAVKPQILEQSLADLTPLKAAKPLVLSVVAGKTIAGFESFFGQDSAVIRTIPNTPAAIGRGITGMAVNQNTTAAQKQLAIALLSSIGEVVEVDNESLIDVVTAVSGSGPAYVFYMTECLAKAGVDAGLDEELAMQLARATIAGAGELMRQTGIAAGTLRENVTSPNGTTYAALCELMADDGLAPLMSRTVAAAKKRSQELAS